MLAPGDDEHIPFLVILGSRHAVSHSSAQFDATPRAAPPVTLRDIGWLILVCLVALLVRLPFLTMPMIADEGGYAYATRGWLSGTGDPYDDLWISRPQGIFYVYAAVFETLGTDTVAFRIAAWISVCGTAIAVWAIAQLWRPQPAAAIASLIFNAKLRVGMLMPLRFLLRHFRSWWP